MEFKINLKKHINEDFYNPFDGEEEDVKKGPDFIKDKGGPLIPRKETFNLARVEYSKRPGGEFTVMSKTHFAKGEIIEICPVILLGEEAKAIDKIKDVVFEIDKEKGQWGLALGYGSMYKHSDDPNVEYAYNRLTKQMYFITKKPIKLHQELTINYGQDYWTERSGIDVMTDLANRTDDNQGMPKTTSKDKNESEVQPNAADIRSDSEMRRMASPANPHNPVRSGVAIIGGRG